MVIMGGVLYTNSENVALSMSDRFTHLADFVSSSITVDGIGENEDIKETKEVSGGGGNRGIARLVEEKCSEEIITNRPEARSGCAEVCAPALCCVEESTVDAFKSCNVDCGSYEACGILRSAESANMEDVPQEVVQEKCSLEAIGASDEGRGMCEGICFRAACCFEDGDHFGSCNVNCGNYDDCANLEIARVDAELMPEEVSQEDMKQMSQEDMKQMSQEDMKLMSQEDMALSSLEEVAAVCAISRDECESICKPASCCFEDGESCDVACGNYAPCETLETTAALVAEMCSEPGAECMDICDPASCCYDGESEDCHYNCEHYAACGILSSLYTPQLNGDQFEPEIVLPMNDAVYDSGDNAPVSQMVQEKCSDQTIHDQSPAPCIDICNPARCCFKEQDEDGEIIQSCDFNCGHYEACGILNDMLR
eukprot:CAMPEP_0195508132 /NCGR_PEP_ID=MMETSP0794_2-20130614/1428_1 /TAXON_ID=515487 /ORGANISM="Stephanopyxis turris, Strain CCMP 815" /LENGTH=424 /DNA_ID=CAMNT_0040635019 /DNA_START=5 /DNA_END=1279 /DNA_ORIENTATION=-